MGFAYQEVVCIFVGVKQKSLINKLSLIRWLMIFSQLVLLTFAAQWLFSEYRREQARIQKELAGCFREAEGEVTDSILKVTVIDPLIRERRDSLANIQIRLDSPGIAECYWTTVEDTPVDGRKIGMVAITTEGNRRRNDTTVLMKKMLVKGSDQVMLRGVKLMIREMGDSLLVREGSSLLYGDHWIDTARMRERFLRKTSALYPEAWFHWDIGTLSTGEISFPEKPFEYVMVHNDRVFAARLDNPHRLVIGSMIPAVLFSLVVVLLTAASFVIAFRSLKKQILLNRMMAGMVSNITHELKTPVSTVKVALEALRRFDVKQDASQTDEYVDMAVRELDRLDLLVSQVLNAALYEQGALVITREPVDLPGLIRHTLEGCQPRLDKEGASVQIRGQESFGDEPVQADPLHLQGVLINLIDNSLKHGYVNPEITIELVRIDTEVILRFSNNGPPIPGEYLNRIFEKFFRVPDGDRHDTKGFGLGLSYASMVMQLHGGGIRAENDPGGGVSFILRLPLQNP